MRLFINNATYEDAEILTRYIEAGVWWDDGSIWLELDDDTPHEYLQHLQGLFELLGLEAAKVEEDWDEDD